jgi:hypothetical protein
VPAARHTPPSAAQAAADGTSLPVVAVVSELEVSELEVSALEVSVRLAVVSELEVSELEVSDDVGLVVVSSVVTVGLAVVSELEVSAGPVDAVVVAPALALAFEPSLQAASARAEAR